MLRANARTWQRLLAEPGAADRRAHDKWSPLEYGCHIRDSLRLYHHRLGLILTEDDPLYPNWDQDETAVADRYGEQDPAEAAQRRRGVHGRDVRALLHPRPGPSRVRRDRGQVLRRVTALTRCC